jgi:hypothetical protein
MRVRLNGIDANSGEAVQAVSDIRKFYRVTRAEILMSAAITAPAGAMDGTVTEGQDFNLQAIISKQGKAGVFTDSSKTLQIELNIPAGSSLSLPDNDALKTYQLNIPLSWRILTGDYAQTANKEVAGLVKKIYEANRLQADKTQENKPSQTEINKWTDELIQAGAGMSGRISQEDSLRVVLKSKPNDENTRQPAPSLSDTLIQKVTINQTPTIGIKSIEWDSTVSGGQTFTITVVYNGTGTDGLYDRIATIGFPTGSGFQTAASSQNIPVDSSLTWVITAPDAANRALFYDLTFGAYGFDVNNDNTISMMDTSLTLRIEPKARVKLAAAIISPPTAVSESKSVSRMQRFEIMTSIEIDSLDSGIRDMAGLTGTGELTAVFDTLFTLEQVRTIEGDLVQAESVQGSIPVSDTLIWVFRAPNIALNARNFVFNLTGIPNDENTGQDAFVAAGRGSWSDALSVIKQQLTVVNITDETMQEIERRYNEQEPDANKHITIDNNFKKGAKNAPLLVFRISGPGNVTLNIDSLALQFLQPIEDKLLSEEKILEIIDSIKVVPLSYLMNDVPVSDFLKPSAGNNFAEAQIADSSSNPVGLRFTNNLVLAADQDTTIAVLVSFKPNAQNQSFRAALQDLWAWDVNRSLPLDAVDEKGTPLAESGLLVTSQISIIPTNMEDAFITYPNPFGKIQEWANIRFFLENYSNVEIYIFTLVGELVWSQSFQNQAPGAHSGDSDSKYRWDGKNDRGNVVLNGVYLCVLKVTEIGSGGSGGATKTYTRKIAYIK